MQQARALNKAPYEYIGNPHGEEDYTYKLDEIAVWSDEVSMRIFCTPGFLYFDNSEDRLNFRLRWC